ncbi:MAG: SLBB domain-containing protein [Eubacterium sp.]|nr:SLBB domain-containing protein [Eubacterium sp.]MCM1216316.1 SLBB domain-containing protein [Lachnospiraceae bacterium]MCM1303827.1 SLBB domain-containing protein [Butyrivibrio sp.]MCM1342869.1 SLBB domain-containing protein [Muribaculaceae bacterium]MCM1240083.1 SLBB domain-containing protein [Lachnospiraceae bacterium]
MEIQELKQILQNVGTVGAGGAGFPTYAKLDERAEVILMNCAECEPLLKLHRQLLEQCAGEILKAFDMIAQTVGAKEAVIGIKREYKATLKAIDKYIDAYPNMRVQLLDGAYPMGDEVVLIYEATGRVIRPGGLPIEEGVAVFNVETVYNVYRAVERDTPVIDKLVTVVGEVEHPITVRVPLGATIKDVVAYAGKVTTGNPAYLVGGPMMGNLAAETAVVTKTTNAVIVLDQSHSLIRRKNRNAAIDLKRAASSCCQCETCTNLCPRHALGHPIEPHKFMRSAANQDFQDTSVFLNTMFCSSCGLCENFSCPQGLSPRSLIADYKLGLRKAGVKPPADVKPAPVKESRQYRKVPEERLAARLGLSRYDVEAPLQEDGYWKGQDIIHKVKILTSQHIGAPAVPTVETGAKVKAGDMIAKPGNGLSVAIHASMDGIVREVTEKYIVITER